MGLLTGLLTFPVTGPVRGLMFIAEQVREEAEAVLARDESRVQAELMDLNLRRDLGEISDAEYDEQEAALLEELNAIRAAMEAPPEPEELEAEDDFEDDDA